MENRLMLVESGALINPDKIDALYNSYKDGATELKVFALVNGVDIVIKIIPITSAGLTAAREQAAEYMAEITQRANILVDIDTDEEPVESK